MRHYFDRDFFIMSSPTVSAKKTDWIDKAYDKNHSDDKTIINVIGIVGKSLSLVCIEHSKGYVFA